MARQVRPTRPRCCGRVLFPKGQDNATPRGTEEVNTLEALSFNLFDNTTVQVSPLRWDFSSYAFNVVAPQCATGYYTFAHECGHNQGAHHDRANTGGGTGLYSYSYGYQQVSANPTFRTIMAYNCSPGCTRVNYRSNPNVSYNGYPTGVLYTAANSADNRMTLNNSRVAAANWRPSATKGNVLITPQLLLMMN
ncbi:MAG: zinc-dependent metalloprotease [Desulfovibrio sp.]|nr:zinc-dependent metalloprotease [Desulfovibrio sp.]MCA1985321.1 zinc-dependent metalloprotease [Desulfovibrio sp.]